MEATHKSLNDFVKEMKKSKTIFDLLEFKDKEITLIFTNTYTDEGVVDLLHNLKPSRSANSTRSQGCTRVTKDMKL